MLLRKPSIQFFVPFLNFSSSHSAALGIAVIIRMQISIPRYFISTPRRFMFVEGILSAFWLKINCNNLGIPNPINLGKLEKRKNATNAVVIITRILKGINFQFIFLYLSTQLLSDIAAKASKIIFTEIHTYFKIKKNIFPPLWKRICKVVNEQ